MGAMKARTASRVQIGRIDSSTRGHNRQLRDRCRSCKSTCRLAQRQRVMRLAMVALAKEIDATSLWGKRTSIVSPVNGESTGSPEKINYVFGYVKWASYRVERLRRDCRARQCECRVKD